MVDLQKSRSIWMPAFISSAPTFQPRSCRSRDLRHPLFERPCEQDWWPCVPIKFVHRRPGFGLPATDRSWDASLQHYLPLCHVISTGRAKAQ